MINDGSLKINSTYGYDIISSSSFFSNYESTFNSSVIGQISMPRNSTVYVEAKFFSRIKEHPTTYHPDFYTYTNTLISIFSVNSVGVSTTLTSASSFITNNAPSHPVPVYDGIFDISTNYFLKFVQGSDGSLAIINNYDYYGYVSYRVSYMHV